MEHAQRGGYQATSTSSSHGQSADAASATLQMPPSCSARDLHTIPAAGVGSEKVVPIVAVLQPLSSGRPWQPAPLMQTLSVSAGGHAPKAASPLHAAVALPAAAAHHEEIAVKMILAPKEIYMHIVEAGAFQGPLPAHMLADCVGSS